MTNGIGGDAEHERETKSQRIRNGHARSEDGNEDEDDEDDEYDGWTVETFKDRPLKKSNSTIHMVSLSCHGDADPRKLKTLTEKLKEVIKKTEDGMVQATDNARAVEDASPDDDVSSPCFGKLVWLRRPAERNSKLTSLKRDFNELLNSARSCRSRLMCWIRCSCPSEEVKYW